MTKQLSAVLAAAAFVGLSASAFAKTSEPFSVNESGPVLTAQQQEYQDHWQANRDSARGVAGRPGLEAQETNTYEVQTPSRGGPLDD